MKKHLMTAAALALLATTAQAGSFGPAHPTTSEVRLFSSGYWHTSYMARNDAGEPMCKMDSEWQFLGGVTGAAMIKWTAESGLFMHITKSNWSLPAGQEVQLSVTFDRGARDATGTTVKSNAGSTLVGISVPKDDEMGFLDDIGEADQLKIQFTTGNEPAWTGKMVGSRAAKNWFVACMAKIDSVAEATQPVVPSSPTQPVVPSQPAPAQPVQPMPTTSEMLFVIPPDVSAGHMNVRNGPGANHGLLGAIPAGQTVRASRCVRRDDGIAGADWCLVTWNGLTGWVSQVGLMPVTLQPTQPVAMSAASKD
jgi:hypothetical protein